MTFSFKIREILYRCSQFLHPAVFYSQVSQQPEDFFVLLDGDLS
jgi:hypothetical protein